jgi:hypothetical protein
MKLSLKASSFVFAMAIAALAANANAQTYSVQLNALGSSALFLEAGLAASHNASIGATCIWTSDGSTSGTVASASDTSTSSTLTDSGKSWVAWTPSATSSSDTCANFYSTDTVKIWAYLQTDSVVGNRCLFNAKNSSTCTITYPLPASSASSIATANQISSGSEHALPYAIANALQAAQPNAAGTDIRPEDASFAVARALTSCGTAIGSTKYLGLGYSNGADIQSVFSSSKFHVINFSLPSTYYVTPIGATPILVVINGSSSGFLNTSNTLTNISSATLAKFLDGTYSYTGQAYSSSSASGNAVTTLIREPLSGTYNTMEYNVPNTIDNSTYSITGNYTSQDIGYNQLSSQQVCGSTQPLNVSTTSGGSRKRAIGTGEELKAVYSYDTTITGNEPDRIGYGFWSVANFKGFTSTNAPNARYLKVDGIDPLYNQSSSTYSYSGAIPLTGSSNLTKVTLTNVANGNYPIWSFIRLVTADSTAKFNAETLATATKSYVSFGSTTATPDFVSDTSISGAPTLSVVRSHFIQPAGTGQPTTAYNGKFGLSGSSCASSEVGGDVGGVVLNLSDDSDTCDNQTVKTGTTGQRR